MSDLILSLRLQMDLLYFEDQEFFERIEAPGDEIIEVVGCRLLSQVVVKSKHQRLQIFLFQLQDIFDGQHLQILLVVRIWVEMEAHLDDVEDHVVEHFLQHLLRNLV